MKKGHILTPFIIALTIIVGGYITYTANKGSMDQALTFGAPTGSVRYERELTPELDSKYYLGTTTPSLLAWKGLIVDEICLNGDCQTAWSAGGGEANTGASLGTGLNIYDSKVGAQLRFNSIAAGSNITLSTSTDSNTIVISSTASGSGGSGNVSTSTGETSGNLAYWTSTNATPALLGKVGTTTLTASSPLALSNPVVKIGGSNSVLTLDTTGTWSGNAGTASALAANGTNASAGNAILGVDASGNAEGAFDVWTEAENTAAGYVAGTRTLTVAGTANQITSSAGAQDLSANRTWTLSFPSQVIFPSYASSTLGFSTPYSSSTLATIGTLTLPNISGTQCLHSISGVVSGTGSDCGSGGGLSSYDAWTHPAVGVSATTSQINMAGFLSTASSTVTATTTITTSAGLYGLGVVPSGDVGNTSAPVKNGAFVVDNTLNTATPGFYVSSDQAGVPSNPLAIIRSSSASYNQGLLWLLGSASNTGGAAYGLKIQDANPDIEFRESDQTSPIGEYEIDVNNDLLRFNGRNTPNNSFDTIAWLARNDKDAPGWGGRFCIGCGFTDLNTSEFNIVGTTTQALPYFTISTASTTAATGDVFSISKTKVATMPYSSSTIYSSFASASSTVWRGGGLTTDCDDTVNSKLLWDTTTGQFSCGSDQTGAGGTIDGTGIANTIATWTDNNTIQATSSQPLYVGALHATTTIGMATSTFMGDVKFGTSTGDNLFQIVANRDYPSSSSVGGMVRFINTNNAASALTLYGNHGSGATAPQFENRCDNATFDFPCERIDYDGTNDGLVIVATAAASNAASLSNTGVDHTLNVTYTGSTAFKGAGNFTSTNAAGSAMQISGVEDGFGALKVAQTSASNDPNSAVISIIQNGTAGQGFFADTVTGYTGIMAQFRPNNVQRWTMDSWGRIAHGSTTTSPWLYDIATSTSNQLALTDPSASANLKHWTLSSTGGNFYISTSSDLYATSSLPLFRLDSSGNAYLKDLISCDTIDTDANGMLSCGTDATGAGGGSDPFTHPGTNQSATTSLMLFFGNASTTQLTSTSSTYLATDAGGVGIGTTTTSKLLTVFGDQSGGIARIHRRNASTNGVLGTYDILGESTGDMTDGFGAAQTFSIQDTAGVANTIADLRAYRNGSDTIGAVQLTAYNANFAGGYQLFLDGNNKTGAIGTSTSNYALTIYDPLNTDAQLSLSAGAGIAQWTARNAGGNLYLSTTTVAGTATTTTAALSILNTGEVIVRNLFQIINVAGTKVMDVAGSAITLLGDWDFSGATLRLPQAASPTLGVAGKLALDTTSNNLVMATSTNGHIIVASATTTLYAFTATTSPVVSGTTMNLPSDYRAQVATAVICKVSSGTSLVVNLSDSAGTSDTNAVTCTTTETQYALTSNNSYAAYGGLRLEYGTKTGDTGDISIRIIGYRTSN